VQLIATQIEEAGGLDKIKQLQQHWSRGIRRLACEIIDKYFTAEVRTNACILPQNEITT